MKSDLLEAVIGLGAGLFYNSPMEAVVVTLRASKPAEHRGKVIFINAVNEVAREQAQSFLRERHQQKILAAYERFFNDDGFATVATLDQIFEKGYSLAIPLYVASNAMADDSGSPSVDDAIDAWRTAVDRADAAISDAVALLRQEVTK